MARPATGRVVENTQLAEPTFALRFTVDGRRRYVTLGSRGEGWTLARAEAELQNVLADTRRGLWRPADPEPVATGSREVPTFWVFASEWFERQKVEGGRRGGGLTAAGIADLEWRLSSHLLPWFKSMRLDAITVEDIDRYRLSKVRERDAIEKARAARKPLMESYTDPQTGHTTKRRRTALNATSINKTLATLSAILQDAADYELIPRNPAQGRRRRLPSVTLTRTVIDRADHLEALLAAAASLDGDARCRHGQRRALISTLAFGGLRLGECLALTWRDIDLGRGVIRVRQGKTDAAARDVPILGVLRDELDTYSARVRGEPHQLVFGSSTGRQQSPSNIRRRILTPAVERANKALKKAGVVEPIPNVTPHSLRRTAASIWFAIGWAPPAVMAAMGHTTAGLTLSIYARQMNRQDGEPERLKTLIQGGVLAEEKAETPEPTEDKEGLPSNA